MKTRIISGLILVFLIAFATPSPFAGQDAVVDKIMIEKKARRLTLLCKGQPVKTYRVALGRSPEGPKEREGDHKTPEGVYMIDSSHTRSGYHRALHVSYPNANDITRAKALGVSPGGDIMIHGMKNGFGWIGGFHIWVD